MKKIIYFCLCASLFFICPMYSIEAATYEYDELGRVTQVTNEDGSCVTYVYDANGNLVEIETETAIGKTSGADGPSGETTGECGITTQSATDITLQDDAKHSANDNTSVTSDETVSANQSDDFVDEEQEDDKALDLVKEEMEKQEETEAESKKNSRLLALLAAGATGGIVILLWKKLSKNKDEDGEGNVNE